jgi:hypothetical protein
VGLPTLGRSGWCRFESLTKCLPEFHGVEPTRETLLMAIANGDFELIRLIWERLLQEHDRHNRRALEGKHCDLVADQARRPSWPGHVHKIKLAMCSGHNPR